MGMPRADRTALPAGPAGSAREDARPAGPAAVCGRCGSGDLYWGLPIAAGSRPAGDGPPLCASCSRRDRRAAYFRAYYASHKARILDKNRQWARDNKDKIGQLRRARRQARPAHAEAGRLCLDCRAPVQRAYRCRRCSIRHRYATDPGFRARRLETTRRWLQRQRHARTGQRVGQPAPARPSASAASAA
jgi:hypothetical protein